MTHRHRKEVEGIRRVERILGSVCPRIERTNVQAGYGAMRIAIATHNGTAVHTFFELCTSTIGSGSSEDDEGAIPLTTVAGPDVMSEDALVLRLIDEMFSCQQQQQQQPDDHDGVADAETETAYDDDEGVLFRLMQGNLRVLDLGFGIDSGKNISNYLGRNVSDFYSSRRPNSRTAEEMVCREHELRALRASGAPLWRWWGRALLVWDNGLLEAERELAAVPEPVRTPPQRREWLRVRRLRACVTGPYARIGQLAVLGMGAAALVASAVRAQQAAMQQRRLRGWQQQGSQAAAEG